ncbi:hypothetical protein GGX14DRAFT_401387 [Mycena pura]|uniref:Uncharacterized protein n=1 Tax=Mycena pura TaxID=153505 RepID=A0AAD6V4M4_9AGAR|nr:hypothetical protein GGX14DRAFT_401387 [Mycena pura]
MYYDTSLVRQLQLQKILLERIRSRLGTPSHKIDAPQQKFGSTQIRLAHAVVRRRLYGPNGTMGAGSAADDGQATAATPCAAGAGDGSDAGRHGGGIKLETRRAYVPAEISSTVTSRHPQFYSFGVKCLGCLGSTEWTKDILKALMCAVGGVASANLNTSTGSNYKNPPTQPCYSLQSIATVLPTPLASAAVLTLPAALAAVESGAAHLVDPSAALSALTAHGVRAAHPVHHAALTAMDTGGAPLSVEGEARTGVYEDENDESTAGAPLGFWCSRCGRTRACAAVWAEALHTGHQSHGELHIFRGRGRAGDEDDAAKGAEASGAKGARTAHARAADVALVQILRGEGRVWPHLGPWCIGAKWGTHSSMRTTSSSGPARVLCRRRRPAARCGRAMGEHRGDAALPVRHARGHQPRLPDDRACAHLPGGVGAAVRKSCAAEFRWWRRRRVGREAGGGKAKADGAAACRYLVLFPPLQYVIGALADSDRRICLLAALAPEVQAGRDRSDLVLSSGRPVTNTPMLRAFMHNGGGLTQRSGALGAETDSEIQKGYVLQSVASVHRALPLAGRSLRWKRWSSQTAEGQKHR